MTEFFGLFGEYEQLMFIIRLGYFVKIFLSWDNIAHNHSNQNQKGHILNRPLMYDWLCDNDMQFTHQIQMSY